MSNQTVRFFFERHLPITKILGIKSSGVKILLVQMYGTNKIENIDRNHFINMSLEPKAALMWPLDCYHCGYTFKLSLNFKPFST